VHRLNQVVIVLSSLILCSAIISCSPDDRDSYQQIQVLRVGVLPDTHNATLVDRYTPLIDYLAEQIDFPVKLVLSDSYAHLLALVADKQIDMAHFGGATFVKAYNESHVIPLVMRDVDLRFTSSFIVRSDNPLKTLEDGHDAKLSFGSPLSTSGHFMPRYFMSERSISPESFFSQVVYSGTHDGTVRAVRDGRVDIGVANTLVINRLRDSDATIRDQIRTLWETPPYVDYVWAVRAETVPALRIQLRNAFLMLTNKDPDQAAILHKLGAAYYLPASLDDFEALRSILANNNHLTGNRP